MAAFTVFPAIDLRAGKVVRLAQGDPSRQTTYGDAPRAWAERWRAQGADWVHVINLSGAFNEDARANLKALESILAVGMLVELGGGIRDQGTIRVLLEMGVERVFLGTAAIQDPGLAEWALARYGPSRIAADIGAKDGMVMVNGWQESTSLAVLEVGSRFRQLGFEWCVLSDVRRDGVGLGVETRSAIALQTKTGLKVVASGGVSSLEDVHRVFKAGLAGLIIGRSLYEGKLVLQDVMTALAEDDG